MCRRRSQTATSNKQTACCKANCLLSLTRCHGVPISVPCSISFKYARYELTTLSVTQLLSLLMALACGMWRMSQIIILSITNYFLLFHCMAFVIRAISQNQFSRLFCQDQYFIFCPQGASRPRLWSQGLHHWLKLQTMPQNALHKIIQVFWNHQYFCNTLNRYLIGSPKNVRSVINVCNATYISKLWSTDVCVTSLWSTVWQGMLFCLLKYTHKKT